MGTKYKVGGVSVTIGQSQDVTLPPQVFRARLGCIHFDTDKAFLLPPSIPGIQNIKTYYDQHPGLTVLVNGHTDLVGDATYNLQLSNERVQSVAAYLQNKVDDWLQWYQSPIQSKRWSYTEDQNMLGKLTDASSAPYYASSVTGINDAVTQDACKRFQTDNGLTADGQLGPDTRRALITKYMQLEGTTLPASATLVTHGCGKFHPIDPTSSADQGNRRVEIFLFDGPVEPPPEDPCPSPNGCTAYPSWVALATEDVDLCKPLPTNKQRLLITLLDVKEQPRVGVAYRLVVGVDTIDATTDGKGQIDQMVDATAVSGTLSFDEQSLTLQIDALQPLATIAGAQGRLNNLGYSPGEVTGSMNQQTRDALRSFQSSHGIEATGDNDLATQAKLQSLYGS